MPIRDFDGQTFVALIDIAGFKELMKDDRKGLDALRQLYQVGYDTLRESDGVEGFFVSDKGVLFVRTGSTIDRLKKFLSVIKTINSKMLDGNYMLTTSIAYGDFDYHGKLEFDGIEKNPIYGSAYVQAFLDSKTGNPKIQPGQCRLMVKHLPVEIDFSDNAFYLLKKRGNDHDHLYFYWNLDSPDDIDDFEHQYNNSYELKYSGMLAALKMQR